MKTISVACIITGLHVGGAETMLCRLLSGLDRRRFRVRVISLIPVGAIGEDIRALGIDVSSLEMKPGRPSPWALWRLIRMLRDDPPDLLHTWMYHADLIGGLASKCAGGMPVIWCIRHSNLARDATRNLTYLTVRLCARLSSWIPSRIVCCSEATRQEHVRIGYEARRLSVIPNGLDSERFHPDEEARRLTRHSWQLPAEALVVGMVARYHPQKDYRSFCLAAECLLRSQPAAHFVLCGQGADWDNQELVEWIESSHMRDQFRLLGKRRDIPSVMNGFDLATMSSSSGEAFPNVVAEAMSCGVPCVVTDVGDAALIVGETGLVVPPRDPTALAGAWSQILTLSSDERAELGRRARARVIERFSLPDIVRRYAQVYEEVAEASGRRARHRAWDAEAPASCRPDHPMEHR